ncbi:hypothetical protein AVEN_64070-1 [Araneus ventricosus]|uniref:Uncharacterized protein n=1 Tax=Araneus ventricosus TaxID=182803 RepID=A0A4Y2QKX5_ARAVE|nr:hypothetical protein AVEN_64070-1 [Araneus ventricosus]
MLCTLGSGYLFWKSGGNIRFPQNVPLGGKGNVIRVQKAFLSCYLFLEDSVIWDCNPAPISIRSDTHQSDPAGLITIKTILPFHSKINCVNDDKVSVLQSLEKKALISL